MPDQYSLINANRQLMQLKWNFWLASLACYMTEFSIRAIKEQLFNLYYKKSNSINDILIIL